jgi:hypothetical protein
VTGTCLTADDTIEVGGLPTPLNGLAAPEGDEPGWSAAYRAMPEICQGVPPGCDLNENNREHPPNLSKLGIQIASGRSARRWLSF